MTKKAELFKQIRSLERQVDGLEKSLQSRILEILNQETRLVELERRADRLGPLWTTQAGYTVPLAVLSTEHLENLVEGRWLNDLTNHSHFAKNELVRRYVNAGHSKEPSRWARFWAQALGKKS